MREEAVVLLMTRMSQLMTRLKYRSVVCTFQTVLDSGSYWYCSLQINTGTFSTASGSIDLEHSNLASGN